MKANFHLITENDEEVLLVTSFIEGILRKRAQLPTFAPQTDVPTAAPLNDDELQRRDILHKRAGTIFTPHEDVPVAPPIERKNVSPGTSTIGKIGETAKLAIMSDVANGKQPPKKYAEHLKLLWKRGEVKFDGKEWYL